jgi:hypothetical protein
MAISWRIHTFPIMFARTNVPYGGRIDWRIARSAENCEFGHLIGLEHFGAMIVLVLDSLICQI